MLSLVLLLAGIALGALAAAWWLAPRRAAAQRAALEPVAAQLGRLERELAVLERERAAGQGSLAQLVRGVGGQLEHLRAETGSLVNALARPHVRGAWGELALRNCVRAAGMTERVDFDRQVPLDGGALRPDMTVTLPNGGVVIVDAKVPLDAYLATLEGDDEPAALERHARQLRRHVDALAAKAYHAHSDAPTPEFVVCFLPNEALYAAALERDPSVLEHGAARGVLLATPTTLIALLHAVRYGWREQTLERSAHEVADAARELHRRCGPFLAHLDALGQRLRQATQAYDETIGSLDARVLPQLRRIERAGAGSEASLDDPQPIHRFS